MTDNNNTTTNMTTNMTICICLLSLVGDGVFHTCLIKQEFTPPAAGAVQEFDLEKLTDDNARLVFSERTLSVIQQMANVSNVTH